MEQRAKVYRHYFDDVLRSVDRKVPGSCNLQRIGDEKTAAAFADTMFAHGRHGGAEAIQKAINKVTPDSVEEDGKMGPMTFKAYQVINSDPEKKEALLEALADERWDMVKDRDGAEGWRLRIDHFRFQNSS